MAPSQLRQVREIHGDDEGKVYGALISQEAGTNWEVEGGSSRGKGQRSKRKRRRRGMQQVDSGRKSMPYLGGGFRV